MQVLGYIGYAILIYFALLWTLGVRVKLGVGLFTIMGALFYMVAAILLGVLGINKLHSWWILPLGFIFVRLCTFILATRVPLLYNLIRLLGSLYAGIIRIGIPSEKIRGAKIADSWETVEAVFSETRDHRLIKSVKEGGLQAARILLDDNAEVNVRDSDGRPALGWAAYKGYTEIVKLLLERGADANAETKKGTTALMFAAEQNHMEVMKLLLANGADVNAKTIDNGQTALMSAVQKGHSAPVKLLLENGADVNAVNIKGATALLVAACIGNEEIGNLLLQRGAEVNAKTHNGLTSLSVARKNGHRAMARLLEKAGAKEYV